jgi:hypothetical protein
MASVTVTCLDVDGNVATAGGELTPPITYLGLRIRHLNLSVQDNGPNDLATGISWIDRERPPDFSPCQTPAPISNEIVQGNFVVIDGTP